MTYLCLTLVPLSPATQVQQPSKFLLSSGFSCLTQRQRSELPMPYFHSSNFSSPHFSFLFLNPPFLEIPVSLASSLCIIEAVDKSDWFLSVFLLVPPALLHTSICRRPLAAIVTFVLAAWQAEAVTSNSWKPEFSVPSSKDFKKSKCRLYLSSAWWEGTFIGRRIIRTSPGDCSILAGMS